MNVIRFEDVEAFYARVEGYLAAHEAEHNLTLGIMSTIRNNPLRYGEPFFESVEQDQAIQLVVLMTPPRPPVLSLAASPAAVDTLVEYFFDAQIALPGVTDPPEKAAGSRNVVGADRSASRGAHADADVQAGAGQPGVGCDGTDAPGCARDRDLLVDWELAFVAEAFPDAAALPREDAERMVDFRFTSPTNHVFLWQDAAGAAVSLTASDRRRRTGWICPVYTPPEQRGHGYASALVAGVS